MGNKFAIFISLCRLFFFFLFFYTSVRLFSFYPGVVELQKRMKRKSQQKYVAREFSFCTIFSSRSIHSVPHIYVVDPRKPLFCLQHLPFLFFPYVLRSWFQQFFVLYLNSEFPVNFSGLFLNDFFLLLSSRLALIYSFEEYLASATTSNPTHT